MIDDAKFKRDYQIVPKGVVCSRGNTYDAEVSVAGKHYVVASSMPTREGAKIIADEKAEEVYQHIEAAAAAWAKAKGLREAKP